MISKLLLLALASVLSSVSGQGLTSVQNNCITFSVGQGTGCDWMCNYCSNMLGTNNYYFTDNVCTYETGGCVGNPVSGKQYTCCSSSEEYNDEL
jgi:hypothetical protein